MANNGGNGGKKDDTAKVSKAAGEILAECGGGLDLGVLIKLLKHDGNSETQINKWVVESLTGAGPFVARPAGNRTVVYDRSVVARSTLAADPSRLALSGAPAASARPEVTGPNEDLSAQVRVSMIRILNAAGGCMEINKLLDTIENEYRNIDGRDGKRAANLAFQLASEKDSDSFCIKPRDGAQGRHDTMICLLAFCAC